MCNHINEKGFTLVEWLMVFGIELIVLTGLTRLYLDMYTITHSIVSAHDSRSNERIALGLLAHDIRMAGFIGCPNLKEIHLPASHYLLTESLVGSCGHTKKSHLPSLSKTVVKDSDILYLQYTDSDRIPVHEAKDTKICFVNNSHFSLNTVLLISDCKHAEVFTLANLKLRHSYAADARVSRFYRIVYYVARTDRLNSRKQPIYALYRQDLNRRAQPSELVENIEKLTIYYGILEHSDRLRYVTHDQVNDWGTVRNVTVRLHLSRHPKHKDNKRRFLDPQGSGGTLPQTTMIRARANDSPS